MKKYFLFAIAATIFAASTASAQNKVERITKVSTDTSLNTDTVIVTLQGMASSVKGFQVVVKKITGNPATGYVLLQGSIDGTNWVNASNDTLTVSNQTINTKVWPLTSTTYFSYRAWYKSAGTQTSTLALGYMRRPDE